MATYLLTWNSAFENWPDLESDIKEIRDKGNLTGRWSCGNRKNILIDDRVFLIKLGEEPRGIMASGWAACVS